ncbi:MAG: pilus assembly protein PilY [Gammaproteobacteria bacterium]|nr:pilus assembly protein PilY [Gammaproteobacteria bacterium]
MNAYLNRKYLTLAAASLLAVLNTTAAHADDTEIYVGGNAGASVVRPNVLFIIDTSGSMNDLLTLTNSNYDPTITYSGSCNSSNIYWSSTGKPVTCSTANYFSATSNQCSDSKTALGSTGAGFYVGNLARYKVSVSKKGVDNSVWSSFSSSDHTANVECAADNGKFGNGTDTAKPYAANASNGGPWTSTSSKAISWSSSGTNYTLYSANYLNWYYSSSGVVTKTRLQMVKDTFNSLLDGTSGINVGLMRYDQNGYGGYFIQPMQELNSTSRPILEATVNGLSANGNTPLAETLYESSLYWRGLAVDFGNSSSPAHNITSVLDPSDPTKYKSPIEYQCQKNFVVYMTDGEPTWDSDADTKIKALPNFASLTNNSQCDFNAGNDCLDELAQWMYKSDLISGLNDKQNVITYTIGLNIDVPLLSDTANKGGGKYYTIQSATDLASAFTSIVTDILAVNTTFIAPAVTVNAFNRLNYRDDLYFSVFRPAGTPVWPGNVKHYKLAGTPSVIVDAGGAAAVDVNTGFFSGNSTSIWTLAADAPDGDDVSKGGAAGLLSTTRNIYTYPASTAPSNVDLTATANIFNETNANITKALLNIPTETDAYRTELLQWARGVDVLDDNQNGLTTDARRAMGDILHSKPVLMTYGGTDASPDITLFVGSNEGFIHAFNATTGAEQFAFIPKELYPNLPILFENSATSKHPYGMDGPISLWFNDVNKNGLLLDSTNNVEAGEFLYLYAGMRRGGNHYYSLDVTNRSVPKLLWQIDGGTGNFAELGQTWSRPVVAKIKLYNGSTLLDRNVLIFGGGYDTNQDTATIRTDDAIGHAIYIVDAATGQRLWWASSTNTANLVLPTMTYSIPSDITAVDIDRDGYADRLYVGDMGGQIWRIDFNNKTNTGAANFATGGLLAALSGTDAANNRRFYYAPDVALIATTTGDQLSISIGSGYREHPLETTSQDRFYMIRDKDVYAPPADTNGDGKPDYPNYTEASLYDATANTLGLASGSTLSAAQTLFNNAHGWYIRLVKADGTTYEGEKVLANSVTFDGKLFFTTFTPVVSAQATACTPSQGTAKVYAVNLLDATPVSNLAADNINGSVADRSATLVRGGIPPEPKIIFTSSGNTTCLIGTETCPSALDFSRKLQKSFWKQN